MQAVLINKQNLLSRHHLDCGYSFGRFVGGARLISWVESNGFDSNRRAVIHIIIATSIAKITIQSPFSRCFSRKNEYPIIVVPLLVANQRRQYQNKSFISIIPYRILHQNNHPLARCVCLRRHYHQQRKLQNNDACHSDIERIVFLQYESEAQTLCRQCCRRVVYCAEIGTRRDHTDTQTTGVDSSVAAVLPHTVAARIVFECRVPLVSGTCRACHLLGLVWVSETSIFQT